MDTHGLQHDPDVYGAILGLSWRIAGNQARTPVWRIHFYRSFDPAAIFTEPCGDARTASCRRSFGWHVLPADDDICPAQSADALHDLRHRCLLNGHSARHIACGADGS